ncbi:Procollagen C-endopeptidase enhancer 2 [Sciurus carolinensis]|uniref:Procollagen C-endopeptidase enhancer 2 n=1 Tax=Sciurus carolinensis TaxID=30640 RepID=A0AA41MIK7_SCICA|nr:Procollagen C-endopeptidase enhancer 2 [Sciurus carolinensis]
MAGERERRPVGDGSLGPDKGEGNRIVTHLNKSARGKEINEARSSARAKGRHARPPAKMSGGAGERSSTRYLTRTGLRSDAIAAVSPRRPPREVTVSASLRLRWPRAPGSPPPRSPPGLRTRLPSVLWNARVAVGFRIPAPTLALGPSDRVAGQPLPPASIIKGSARAAEAREGGWYGTRDRGQLSPPRRPRNPSRGGPRPPSVPEGKVVVLNFRFIDLESDNLCRYDFVDVYNGHANGQRIGRFCGTFRPGALVSSGNKMMVQMISDANTAGNGFMAMFSAAEPNERGDQYCGGRLERPAGSFKTPNWPDRDYPAGVTCVWHIIAPKNQLIELKFEKFDVERDNYCRYDYVAVFNGGEVNDAKRIGKYCGDSPPAPIVSERNELLIQFLSDLSLTADGFIGHYKFRPKKLPTTTAAPITTTFPVTMGLKPTVALCQQKCRRSGTLESNYCSSNFVLAGTVITTVTRGGSLHATVSIINIYKEGSLAIQQAGKNMSAKVIVVCKQCPLLRRGLNYIIMGQVGEDGRGKIMPNSFIMMFKTKNQKLLNALKNKQC